MWGAFTAREVGYLFTVGKEGIIFKEREPFEKVKVRIVHESEEKNYM